MQLVLDKIGSQQIRVSVCSGCYVCHPVLLILLQSDEVRERLLECCTVVRERVDNLAAEVGYSTDQLIYYAP